MDVPSIKSLDQAIKEVYDQFKEEASKIVMD